MRDPLKRRTAIASRNAVRASEERPLALDEILAREEARHRSVDRYGFADHQRRMDLERSAKPMFTFRRLRPVSPRSS